MHIVHISTSDIGHGAGIAAYRLLRAQRKAGYDAIMFVAEKLTDDPNVICVCQNPPNLLSKGIFTLELAIERALNLVGPQNLYSVAGRYLLRDKRLATADVFHLHNIHWHSRNFSLLLPLILGKQKPVVWTYHDMWPITGHCIYSRDCERWLTKCGKCPYPRAYLRQFIDTSRLQCHLKRAVYKRAGFTVVTPSRWLENKVTQSPLLEGHKVRTIVNSVDRSLFKPVEKRAARDQLGIKAHNSPALLFVSALLDNPLKGFSCFEEALCQLHDRGDIQDVQVFLVGRGKVSSRLKSRFMVNEFGYVDDLHKMALIYSAADLYVMPSILDNLPSVVLESMACGTPVVCFDTGGIPEMVLHGVNGLVARNGDVADLAVQIATIMADDELCERMAKEALRTVAEYYGPELQVQRHLALYQELLDRHV